MNPDIKDFIEEYKNVELFEFKDMPQAEQADLKAKAQIIKNNSLYSLLMAKLINDYQNKVLIEDREELKGRIRGLIDFKHWIDTLSK
jgi:hypothetical protein